MMKSILRALLLLAALLVSGTPLLTVPVARAAETGTLPLPRFASLRSDQVNMRAGPGERYPIDWSYMRRDLPVEIIAEFDVWRKIRDPDGVEGWVHQQMLTGRRMVYITADRAMLRRTADELAAPAAWVQKGVVAKLVQCPKQSSYCRVETSGYSGWIKRSEIWGVYKDETIE